MSRVAIVIVLLILLLGTVAAAEEFDISGVLGTSFADIALLPSRLTYYNEHDDAATASYTCCKPSQHKEMQQAIKANEVFLDKYGGTDFGDDTLMHYAWVTSVKKDFRAQVSAYSLLLDNYPHSPMADDAAWGLAQMLVRDKDHLLAIDALEFIVHEFPGSTYADDAYMALVGEYNEMDDPQATIDALIALTELHPTSDYGAKALCMLARKYYQVEAYDQAIAACEDVLARYPLCDCADDAQMMIANALRLQGHERAALDAYEFLIYEMPGSSQANAAIREANSLLRRIRQRGDRAAGEYYDTLQFDPSRAAQDLWQRARHHENYREYADAVTLFRQFIDRFPGNDNLDDAFFHIGECYRQMKILFEDINKAKGPDDLYRVSDSYQIATGARGMIPAADELLAIQDASSAYAVIINGFFGSPLRDDALYQIAIAYTPYENPEAVTPDTAYTFQQLLIHFPGSSYEFEALVKLIRFYADPSNYEVSQQMYPQAAAVMPVIFPPGLENDQATFLHLMRLYKRHTEHAWFEAYKKHIKYVLAPPDLTQPAYYYQAALLMDQGQFGRAAQLLSTLVRLRTGDFAARAQYLLARCHQKMGHTDQALAVLDELENSFADSGLADDARWLREQLANQTDPASEYAAKVTEMIGKDVIHMDSHVGQNIVVFAPYTVAGLMRQYNMPNIWDQAQEILEQWAGVEQPEKVVIYVDPSGKQSAGEPVRVSAWAIKDPPDWMLGLHQLSQKAVRQATEPWLADQPALTSGLAQFAAASLQYDLVTETRDAIGSASAVKLPQEAVINSRDRALKALEEYVRAGSERQEQDLGGHVVAGMLYAILDVQGYSAERLIDREPFRGFFTTLKMMPAEVHSMYAFGTALDRALGGAARQQLLNWGIPVYTG